MAAVLANKFNTWIIVFLTLVLSLTLNHFWESLIAMAAFAILRRNTGGRHMPNLDLCVLFSVSLFLVIPLITLPFKIILAINSIAFLILIAHAVTSFKKTPREIYIRRQAASCLLILAGFIPVLDMITLACFAQSILLLGEEVKLP
jgi:accessory gene regulator protein AgrB